MRNIYLVTHAEATHHVSGVVGGWLDSELTVRGRSDAHAAAQTLLDRVAGQKTTITTSDLRRAWQTADIIAGVLRAPVTEDPDLREKSFGLAEGKPKEWLARCRVPVPDEGERLRHDEGIPGAETRWQLAQRSYRAMDRLLAQDVEHQIVVTHGGPVTFLITAWLGMPIEDSGRAGFPVPAGSITWLHKDPGNFSHVVKTLGDARHLKHC